LACTAAAGPSYVLIAITTLVSKPTIRRCRLENTCTCCSPISPSTTPSASWVHSFVVPSSTPTQGSQSKRYRVIPIVAVVNTGLTFIASATSADSYRIRAGFYSQILPINDTTSTTATTTISATASTPADNKYINLPISIYCEGTCSNVGKRMDPKLIVINFDESFLTAFAIWNYIVNFYSPIGDS
jgi:hypothetical protein